MEAHSRWVLRLGKVRPGGHAYYLEVVGTGVEAPGTWLSQGAGQLGLHGVVYGPDLDAVLSGADPESKVRLGRSHDRVKVAGFDLTFCAPKSVSLLHALGEPDVAAEVRSGHEQAVGEALSYVERYALAVRRSSGPERKVVAVEEVAAGGFVHRTSRALDPHLHTHVVVANLGRSADGTWSALDGRGIYAHAAATGALYHAHLRHELTARLGVRWDPLDKGRADVVGIGPEVRRAFSQRAAAIEAHLVERARTSDERSPERQLGFASASPRARSVAAFATRAQRDPNLAPETLRGWWQSRALEAGMSPRRLEAALDSVPRHLANEELRVDRLEREVHEILGGLGRGVTRRDVVRASCSVLERGAPAKEVERAVDLQISRLEAVEGWAGTRDGPGVGERRHVVEMTGIERDRLDENRRMDKFLSRHGMSHGSERTLGLERDTGLGFGL